jgi:hypothetical protein
MDGVGPTIVGRVASAVGEGATSIAPVHSYLATLAD